MNFVLRTCTRSGFIKLSHTIGEVLKSLQKEKPWFLSLGADINSGKSLIALSIDQTFNPAAYPNGLTKDISADRFLRSDPARPRTVVFQNFRGSFAPSELEEIKSENPGVRVVIGSNLIKSTDGGFNAQDYGLGDEHLHINVRALGGLRGVFIREVSIAPKDRDLTTQINCMAAPYRLFGFKM